MRRDRLLRDRAVVETTGHASLLQSLKGPGTEASSPPRTAGSKQSEWAGSACGKIRGNELLNCGKALSSSVSFEAQFRPSSAPAAMGRAATGNAHWPATTAHRQHLAKLSQLHRRPHGAPVSAAARPHSAPAVPVARQKGRGLVWQDPGVQQRPKSASQTKNSIFYQTSYEAGFEEAGLARLLMASSMAPNKKRPNAEAPRGKYVHRGTKH